MLMRRALANCGYVWRVRRRVCRRVRVRPLDAPSAHIARHARVLPTGAVVVCALHTPTALRGFPPPSLRTPITPHPTSTTATSALQPHWTSLSLSLSLCFAPTFSSLALVCSPLCGRVNAQLRQQPL